MFSEKHLFLVAQILSLSVAMITQKKLLMKGRLNLFSIAFWAYLFGTFGTFLLYVL